MYQGDLNSSNELHQDGHFVGLIDFNLSGTDVNINVFVNETNCFPEEEDFDRLSVEQIVDKMETEQADMLSVIVWSKHMISSSPVASWKALWLIASGACVRRRSHASGGWWSSSRRWREFWDCAGGMRQDS